MMEGNKTVNLIKLQDAVLLLNEKMYDQLYYVIDLTSDDKIKRYVSLSEIGKLFNPIIGKDLHLLFQFAGLMYFSSDDMCYVSHSKPLGELSKKIFFMDAFGKEHITYYWLPIQTVDFVYSFLDTQGLLVEFHSHRTFQERRVWVKNIPNIISRLRNPILGGKND